MKTCLCIFTGLTRTFEKTYQNILENLILINEKEYKFVFIVNTENLSPNMELFLKSKLNINNHKLKNIINYSCDKTIIKTSLHIYFLRLYYTLKQEQNEHYDMYVNLRFDLLINKPIYFNKYINTFNIITGEQIIKNNFHNKDWDLMWLGNSDCYKTFVYLLLNKLLKSWYNMEIQKLEDKCVYWKIDENKLLTDYDIENIRDKTGLKLDNTAQCIGKVIQNLINSEYSFYVGEKFDGVFVKIIRENQYKKSF